MATIVDDLIINAKNAATELLNFEQSTIDDIVKSMAQVIYSNAEAIAKLALEETNLGNFDDKVTKVKSKSENIWEHIKDIKTVGVISHSKDVVEIAEPLGVIAAITPITNPGVTIFSNAMFAIKGRNSVVFSPHPKSTKTAKLVVRLLMKEAQLLGLPDKAIQLIDSPTKALSFELMSKVDYVVATGGLDMVKSAYRCGKPSYGVGPGNVPVLVDDDTNIREAVSCIIKGRTFDNGILCSSEQTLVITKNVQHEVISELKSQGAYLLSQPDKQRLKCAMFSNTRLSTDVIGKSAKDIAQLANITSLEENVKVLVVSIDCIGKSEPFSGEKLAPVLSIFITDNVQDSIKVCRDLVDYQGAGHSAAIHSKNEKLIFDFSAALPVSRILVNQSSALSAGGNKFNSLPPSSTLSCGSWGNNAYSGNITAEHFFNVKRIVYKLDVPKFQKSGLENDLSI